MDLSQRLTAARSDGRTQAAADPHAELKNQVHLLVIGDLGPQLFNADFDQGTLRERVLADIRRHLSQESGLSRTDRDRIVSDLADDILGHGPLERLLADHRRGRILLVSHGGAVRAIVAHAVALADHDRRHIDGARNGSLTTVATRRGALRLVSFNDDGHLPPLR